MAFEFYFYLPFQLPTLARDFCSSPWKKKLTRNNNSITWGWQPWLRNNALTVKQTTSQVSCLLNPRWIRWFKSLHGETLPLRKQGIATQKFSVSPVHIELLSHKLKKDSCLLLGICDHHRILERYVEALKSLHCHSCLHFIAILNKCNAWLCLDHSNFLKTRILTEEHLEHQGSNFMGKILDKQYIIWWSRSLRNDRFLSSRIRYLR